MANIPVPGWNAHRFPQEPIRQPGYLFRNVPKCSRGLKGSVLQQITDRDHFKEAMAEMVLLCNEAIRRNAAKPCPSKPLSLEYIADRLDVDDPCFGYLVRSESGMLQGFVTVTTFTNWQKSFRWDSLHEMAFYYDDSDSEDENGEEEVRVRHRPKRQRKVDRDGLLARELQSTVRLGDPHNEGIVWPRIAEISLLGGLGCGRALVQLVIEELERSKPTGRANYDYIILQATDNSISFYESLGFIRVGAVTIDPATLEQRRKEAQQVQERDESPVGEADVCEEVDAVPIEPGSPEKPDAIAMPSDIVSSPLVIYEVKKAGETPSDIAKKCKVEVWDIIFLNKDIYPDITPRSKLKKGTILHVPQEVRLSPTSDDSSPTKWFIAKENDTPRKIAKKFNVPCKQLVLANLNRLPELQPASRLKEGTRIKVSNLDRNDDMCLPYCHWTFPEDEVVEGGEPSYMMAYRLDKKGPKHLSPVLDSLATALVPYSPPTLLLEAPPKTPQVLEDVKYPAPPKPPKDPPTGFELFMEQQRDLDPSCRVPQLEERWRNLSETKKARYEYIADDFNIHYQRQLEEYEVEYSLWKEMCDSTKPKMVDAKDSALFSKVVRLREDALEGKEYMYW